MINAYLASQKEIDDAAVHLLFSANRWEKQCVPCWLKLIAWLCLCSWLAMEPWCIISAGHVGDIRTPDTSIRSMRSEPLNLPLSAGRRCCERSPPARRSSWTATRTRAPRSPRQRPSRGWTWPGARRPTPGCPHPTWCCTLRSACLPSDEPGRAGLVMNAEPRRMSAGG